MTANNPLTDILGAPLDPDWTMEGLAEQVLGAIAAQRSEEAQEFVLDADATADRQSRRLLRPLLACLATKSAAEAGTPVNLYGGHFSFQRPGPTGPVWILGQFENRPGSVRVTLRRYTSPPPGERNATVPRDLPARVEIPETVPVQDGSTADKQVKVEAPQLGQVALPRCQPPAEGDRGREKPNFYITDENFRSLIGPGYWSIQDLPTDRAEQVRPFLSTGDTLGVFASGTPPQTITDGSHVVGGIDWVRLESRRKANEPPLNVYHFVIKKPDGQGYPVYACREGNCIAPHWSEWKDLDVYW